jgi:hypothetical protein
MKHLIPLALLVVLFACTEEGPTAPSSAAVTAPAFAIETESGNGVSMSDDSGCVHAPQPNRFVCNFVASGLPPGPTNAISYDYWSVKYQCVSERNGKPSPRIPPALGVVQAAVITHDQAPSVDGMIRARNVKISQPAPTDVFAKLLCQTAPYTVVTYLEEPVPYEWKILVWSALDFSYYVQIRDVVYPL